MSKSPLNLEETTLFLVPDHDPAAQSGANVLTTSALQKRCDVTDAPPAHEGLPSQRTRSVKHFFPVIVAGCICFLLVNSISQTYYVRYASEESSSGGSYLLCWFSSICQVTIYPLHMLASWTRRRIHVLRKGALSNSMPPHSVREMIERLGGPRRFALFCLLACALNYIGTYCWYLGLKLLPASLNFVVSKSSVVFSYLFSVPILSEAVQVFHALVILAIIFGVICVSTGKISQDSASLKQDSTGLGVTMVLLQALMSSLYNCLIKCFNSLPRPADISFIMSAQGFLVLLLCWPPLLLLEDSNLAIVQAKPAVAEFLMINSVLAVSYYLAYAIGNVYSTASVMSVSGCLKVPIAAIIDAVVYRLSFEPLYIFGCIMVLLAVLAALYDRAKLKPWPPKFSWLSRILIGRKSPT
jgi:drug/metabolite transporter (DMT)-like permease